MSERHLVTGAFGYSGRAIATALLDRPGVEVETLTGHPERSDPFGGRVRVRRLDFDDPASIRDAMRGVRVVYNTYWVRFTYRKTSFRLAVERNQALIRAAAEAGVERFVHTSITKPDRDSPLPYFSGKAEVEETLRESGLSYAILQPAVFFGRGDVLINNIAWLLRRLPVFGIAGDGRYGVQPIHVDDFAELAIAQGLSRDDVTLDAVGPERFSFEELVRLIAQRVGSRARLVHVPSWVVWAAAKVTGLLVRDVVLTWQEIRGLRAGHLVSDEPPTGTTRLSDWLTAHAEGLGNEYASELSRHYRSASPAPSAAYSPGPTS